MLTSVGNLRLLVHVLCKGHISSVVFKDGKINSLYFTKRIQTTYLSKKIFFRYFQIKTNPLRVILERIFTQQTGCRKISLTKGGDYLCR